MKETKYINLAGCALVMDVDAADMLATYLADIQSRLESSDSKEEIMLDIEARIAELFRQHLGYSHTEVVTKRMVEDVMAQLGTPEMITDGEETTEAAAPAADAPQEEKKTETQLLEEEMQKKLYRDVDNQRVAGVCAGVAAYLGTDVVWLRLLLAISIIFYGCGLFLYLILWLVIPAANTTARKLEMQGKVPSAENIRLEVERQKEYQMAHPNEVKKSSGTSPLGGCLIALAMLLFAPVLFVLFAMIMAIFGLLSFSFSGVPFLAALAPMLGTSEDVIWAALLSIVCGLLIFIIPLITVLVWSHHRNKNDKPMSKWFWISMLLLWLLSMTGCFSSGVKLRQFVSDFEQDEWVQHMDSLQQTYECARDQEIQQRFDSLAAAGVLEVGDE